jgi:tetratricopeptide (TPR) repeat protein
MYRANVERLRADLGKTASRHCGGCHDLPLLVDGMMTSSAAIPTDDLRSHSGVSCRLCHGVKSTTPDGNASFVWDPTPIDAPSLGDPASIAKHKAQVTTKLDVGLCSSCHRGFLSPDMDLPVHLVGVDEPGTWRSSAFTGNGLARMDSVTKQNCIDCHMERTPASPDELGAKHGTIASHRFVGGHTWMASMRGDTEQLKLTQAKLQGAASIDVAGARVVVGGAPGPWHLPADAAPVVPGTRLELDVVIRNLLAGHRFPGGILDAQDTWVEVEIADRSGRVLATSGKEHATDRDDTETHVLRTLVVGDDGKVLDEHEISKFRAQIAYFTIAPRDAQAVRYAFAVPSTLSPAQLPLTVTARLRHRSRTLAMQAAACTATKTPEGAAFVAGAARARDVELDACKAQPITLIAEAKIEVGRGAQTLEKRPAWERIYEHGMALLPATILRQDEPRAVLEAALAAALDPRAKAMVTVQLGWVAAKQGRIADVLALAASARTLAKQAGVAEPAALDAILADAYVRQNRYAEALAPAVACTVRTPENTGAWAVYARVLAALDRYAEALAAATHGLDLNPRDPDLLRTQATALLALRDPRAPAAQTAYTRFRVPDDVAALRIRCSKSSARCMRDRNPVESIDLVTAR